jgi:hypothetical protein
MAMSRKNADELRKALDDPAIRYRIVDAWLLLQKKEELLRKKAELEARKTARGQRPVREV